MSELQIDQEKSKYLSYVREQALYYRDLNISVEDENVRIITLSTCNSQTTNGRDVLIGVISDETCQIRLQKEKQKNSRG